MVEQTASDTLAGIVAPKTEQKVIALGSDEPAEKHIFRDFERIESPAAAQIFAHDLEQYEAIE